MDQEQSPEKISNLKKVTSSLTDYGRQRTLIFSPIDMSAAREHHERKVILNEHLPRVPGY